MIIEIKPRNFLESVFFLLVASFYSITDAIKRTPLKIDSSAIERIEKRIRNNKFLVWKIFIANENYNGYIYLKGEDILNNYPDLKYIETDQLELPLSNRTT